MSALWEFVFGGTTESRNDGSSTERFEDGSSVTRNSDGTVRERTTETTALPFGIGEKVTITEDGVGNILNVQSRR